MTCSVTPRALSPLAAAALGAAVACGLAACASTATQVPASSAAEVSNPLLSPTYSQWLVGPIGRMATRDEIAAYLGLASDEDAADFIEDFWERRDPYPLREDNPLRETFDARAAEADRLYSEAGYLGRRTARGAVHVLYGPPEEIDYEVSPHPDDPPIILWEYPADTPPGLDGRQPDRWVRFIKRGDLTEAYRPLRTPATERPTTRRPGTTRPVDFPEPPI